MTSASSCAYTTLKASMNFQLSEVFGAIMPGTPDWKTEAEAKHEREQEEIRAKVKSGFYLQSFLLVFAGLVIGAVYVVKCLVAGESVVPSSRDAVWLAIVIVGMFPCNYLLERHDRIREVREQRLIRLEMKMNALMDSQSRIASKIEHLSDEVRETYSR
jgi:hypothetical protein